MDGGPSRSRESSGNNAAREWPFDGEFSNAFSSNRADNASRSSLRFLVIQSPVLPPRRKIAVLDVHDEVQVGRDAPTSAELTPRLRLKDMEVSKLHATVFWDKGRDEWAVVDMGSKHGTFLRSAASAIETRLSGSRAASLPRPLRHLDQLSFGRTTFAVHIHPDGLPCEDCSPPDELASIPLASKSGSSHLDTGTSTPTTASAATTTAKEALGSLKRRLLSEHAIPDSKRLKADEGRVQYTDRSSLRRALHPYTHDPVSLPVPAARPSVVNHSAHALTLARYHNPGATAAASTDTAPSDASSTRMPAAISKSNVGHRLLEKQGWSPGAPLGKVPPPSSSDMEPDPTSSRTALLEPLQVSGNVGKQGLGSMSSRTLP
ncbi:hypothetical protein SCHPADRAFT_904192 [Schizopora paradoxa]|uniref:SMAD/FHA domain-containing protein n=1 Tax=Schizopora paradoxa TaxID=27342 RepID=A0A0H2S9F7_9AGAM|nr:hypothetical protein SCHPADRAFT_904192 [Schizopora paradoxa]